MECRSPCDGHTVDLFDSYVAVQVDSHPRTCVSVFNRHSLLRALSESPSFKEFWQHAKKTYPDKEAYFSALTDKAKPYEDVWIEKEYHRYIFRSDFDSLSEGELKKYKDELDAFVPNVYQLFLSKEAIKLNCCVSEVRPEPLVISFTPTSDEESKLADLPAAIFVKVVTLLDTVDIFRVSLVCKRWKSLVNDHPRALTKVEHARTTHLITFTDWMNPSKTTFDKSIEWKYHRFILPNLKNLQMLDDIVLGNENDGVLLETEVSLPSLEFFYSDLCCRIQGRYLDQHFLLSCNSIRYLWVSLRGYRDIDSNTRSQMKHAFRNLIGLDLTDYTLQVLEVLADVDELKLRYLGLGFLNSYKVWSQDITAAEARHNALLAEMFPKLKMLKILRADMLPGLSNLTIKLLTDSKVKLKSAKLREFSFCVLPIERNELNEQDNWTSEALADFAKMLTSNDPELDLSQVYLTVSTEELWQNLQEMNIGFTILKQEDIGYKATQIAELNSVLTKRLLGLEF